MSRTRTPHHRILERLLQRPMDLVTHLLHRRITSHDQSFPKVWLFAFPLRVDAHELQLLPAALDDIVDAQVEFAGHDGGVGFAGELVEKVKGDAIDFVVDVETGLC